MAGDQRTRNLSFFSICNAFKEKPDLRRVVIRALYRIVEAVEANGASTLAFSFNGGKDSVVVLHLLLWGLEIARIRADRRTHGEIVPALPELSRTLDDVSSVEYVEPSVMDEPDSNLNLEDLGLAMLDDAQDDSVLRCLKIVYYEHPDDFEEVKLFVKSISNKYGIDVQHVPMGLRAGLFKLSEEMELRGVFLGVRETDPGVKTRLFEAPCDPGWPEFLRLHVILDWTYDQVWEFIRVLGLPYCSLYDKGYASLGLKSDTVMNPMLLSGDGKYIPAYLLSDPSAERVGRKSTRP